MDCIWSSASFVQSDSLTASAANVLPHQIDGLISDFGGKVERRPKADGVRTRAQGKQAEIEKSFPEFFPRLAVGQIKGDETAAATHGRNHGRFLLQVAQLF